MRPLPRSRFCNKDSDWLQLPNCTLKRKGYFSKNVPANGQRVPSNTVKFQTSTPNQSDKNDDLLQITS